MENSFNMSRGNDTNPFRDSTVSRDKGKKRNVFDYFRNESEKELQYAGYHKEYLDALKDIKDKDLEKAWEIVDQRYQHLDEQIETRISHLENTIRSKKTL